MKKRTVSKPVAVIVIAVVVLAAVGLFVWQAAKPPALKGAAVPEQKYFNYLSDLRKKQGLPQTGFGAVPTPEQRKQMETQLKKNASGQVPVVNTR